MKSETVKNTIVKKTLLSVNVNKIATLRNSRGGDSPNLVKMASHILDCGVRGLTVHPRPDERHIRFTDVFDLKQLIRAATNENVS